MKGRKKKRREFVVCVRNTGCPASLELRKIYEFLRDADAAAHGLIRVIDESGEDYLYPEKFFARLELSGPVETAVLRPAWLSSLKRGLRRKPRNGADASCDQKSCLRHMSQQKHLKKPFAAFALLARLTGGVLGGPIRYTLYSAAAGGSESLGHAKPAQMAEENLSSSDREPYLGRCRSGSLHERAGTGGSSGRGTRREICDYSQFYGPEREVRCG